MWNDSERSCLTPAPTLDWPALENIIASFRQRSYTYICIHEALEGATTSCEGVDHFGYHVRAGPFLMSHDRFTVYGRLPAFFAYQPLRKVPPIS